MSILNLSEVSRQFQINRSTVYKAIKAGRLSRRADGNFDLVEVIRCFGEPSGQQVLNQDIERDSVHKATQIDTEIVALLKQQITEYKQRENEYKDRETRLLDQIDRLQTLIEYKTTQQEKATDETIDTTAVDTNFAAQNLSKKNDKKQQVVQESINTTCSQDILSNHVDRQHQTTSDIPQATVPPKEPKKRGLFRRLSKAFFED